MMDKMDTNELAELMLVRLYDLAEAELHSFFFFPLVQFMPAVGVDDMQEIFKAVFDLEKEGFIVAASDRTGINVTITPMGSAFVEDGGKTGIIARYRENPAMFLPVPGETAGTPAFQDMPEPQSFKTIVQQILDVLIADPTLALDIKQDIVTDLETLTLQLEKSSPNKILIEAMFDNLHKTQLIGPLVEELERYVRKA